MLNRFLVILTFTLLLVSQSVFAQLPSDVSQPSVAVTFAQAGDNLNIGALGGVPLKGVNGHFAWYGQRASEDGETLSETLQLHIEGGPEYKGWQGLIFGDVLRDVDRGLQEVKVGYSAELPKLTIHGWSGTAGLGNAARSRAAVAAATGKSGDDLEIALIEGGVSAHWFGYVNLHHPNGWNVSLKSLHDLDLKNPEITGSVATSYKLRDNLTFDVAYQGIYEVKRRKYFGSLLGAFTLRL